MNESKLIKKSIIKVISAFVLIVGFVSGVLGIINYLQTIKPDMAYEIITNTNVIELHDEVAKLKIIYDSTSLNKENDNLVIMIIRIKNTGGENILKDHFDENDPIGLVISGGTIAEQPIMTNASTEYLKNNIKLKVIYSNKIIFSSVMIDKNEYFDIKLLILHKKENQLSISPCGKISGIKDIQVMKKTDDKSIEKEEHGFLYRTFAGDFLTQLVRSIGYLIFALIFISYIFQPGRPSIYQMHIDSFLQNINENAFKSYLGLVKCVRESNKNRLITFTCNFYNDIKILNDNFEKFKNDFGKISDIRFEKIDKEYVIKMTCPIESFKQPFSNS